MYLLPAAPFSEAVYSVGPGTFGNTLVIVLIVLQVLMLFVPMFLGDMYERSQTKRRRLVTQEPTVIIEMPTSEEAFSAEQRRAAEERRRRAA